MSTKKKSASSGFRRGFLLGNAQKEKAKVRRPQITTTSSVHEAIRHEKNVVPSKDEDEQDGHSQQKKGELQISQRNETVRHMTSSALLDMEDTPEATFGTQSQPTKSILHILDGTSISTCRGRSTNGGRSTVTVR